MPEAMGTREGLMDFSFCVHATPKMPKFLYALHLLVGLIVALAWFVLVYHRPRFRDCSRYSVHWLDILSGFSTAVSLSKCSRPCSASPDVIAPDRTRPQTRVAPAAWIIAPPSETSGTWKVVHSHPPQMQLVNLKKEDVHGDVCAGQWQHQHYCRHLPLEHR